MYRCRWHECSDYSRQQNTCVGGKLLLNRPRTSNLVKPLKVQGTPKRCRGDSVPLDIEFCPPPVTPLGIVLLLNGRELAW